MADIILQIPKKCYKVIDDAAKIIFVFIGTPYISKFSKPYLKFYKNSDNIFFLNLLLTSSPFMSHKMKAEWVHAK